MDIGMYVCITHECVLQFADKGRPDLELVTCSGHAKNGALCILQVTEIALHITYNMYMDGYSSYVYLSEYTYMVYTHHIMQGVCSIECSFRVHNYKEL